MCLLLMGEYLFGNNVCIYINIIIRSANTRPTSPKPLEKMCHNDQIVQDGTSPKFEPQSEARDFKCESETIPFSLCFLGSSLC